MLNNVFKYLEKSYYRYPQNIAVVDRGNSYTYSDLYDASLIISDWINATFGIMRKPFVVLMNGGNSFEALATFMGIALSGNIYVPLDAKLPNERMMNIDEIVDPVAYILCGGSSNSNENLYKNRLHEYNNLQNRKVNIDNAIKNINLVIDSDPIYILFTSGSTGIPKGVTVSHRSVIDFAEEASETIGFKNNDKFLNQAPFYFDASVPDIYCTFRNAASIHIVDRSFYSFPIQLMDYIEKQRITVLYWVPSALVLVANRNVLLKRNISSLKKIMFCGEVMPIKQLNQWMDVLKDACFVNYYGPSETTYASSYYIIERRYNEDESLPIGRAAINTDIIVITEDNRLAEVNEIGEIYIRGSGVAKGYYRNKEQTLKAFVQNPMHEDYQDIVYRTGDLAHVSNDGFLYYDGRKDYQIKHMGYRIELQDIENVANSLDGVIQAVAVYSEEKKEIWLVYEGVCETIDVLLSNKLPNYMVPKRYKQIEAFPMNINGKIDRNKIKEVVIAI